MLRLAMMVALLLVCAAPAVAGPPSYLLLHRNEGPTRQTGPNGPPIRRQEVCTDGYAYGWFGAHPRWHSTRHFGYQRLYTEWSFR
jgi:hypothetical protein